MTQNKSMDRTPGADQEAEWLEAAPPPLSPAQRQVRQRIVGAVGFVLVGVLITSLLVQRHDREIADPPAPATPTASTTPTPPPRATSTAAKPGLGPVVIRNKGDLVAGKLDVDLFALSASAVYRVETATGRVTQTPLELGANAEQSSFLAVPGAVIIRPNDSVPGAIIRDDEPASPLRGLLRHAAFVLPGPGGHLWAGSYDRENRMMLSDLRGRPVGPVSPSPTGWAVSDQAGNLLVSDVGGAYESRPSGLRRVTTGQVSAIGSHHYVVVECNEVHTCTSSVLNRATGERRRLGSADTDNTATGIVSPDGHYAVLSRSSVDGDSTLLLQDLRTGSTRSLNTTAPPAFIGPDGVTVWSPDSRHLLLIADGKLAVLDPATAKVTKLDLGLERVISIALRPGS